MDEILRFKLVLAVFGGPLALWVLYKSWPSLGWSAQLIRSSSAWAQLASIYETVDKPGPRAIRGQSVSVAVTKDGRRLSSSSEGAMICELREDGLYLKVAVFFWKPALLIPWEHLRPSLSEPGFIQSLARVSTLDLEHGELRAELSVPEKLLERMPIYDSRE